MAEFFVRRPIVAMVISIFIVILGVISILSLPIAQYPDITPPMVQVTAFYTGASSLDVEQSVATPLEQEINGVENSIYMQSINTNDGALTIRVSFDVGTDPDMNNVLTQNRVSSATPKLPDEVKRLGVSTKKSLAFPVLLISLTSPNKTYDKIFLSNYTKINVADILARIPGVGRVDVFGVGDYSMRIWIKPDRMAQMGITVNEVVNAIKQQNVIVAGGKFGGEPAPQGTDFTYTVRLKDRLQTEEEFGEIVVRQSTEGFQVRLKDLARIEMGTESYKMYARLNGEDAGVLSIYQSPGSNVMDLAGQVKATMVELAKDFPQDLKYDISLDTTLAISEGIREIITTLYEALLLVILVVFIFLQNWRAMIIPLLAVPVSLVGAFILFPVFGFSINTLSLLGIVLAIGIVVDDAIVVVEAVMVNIEHGMEPREATIKAMKQITAPIIAITLVLVAVFIPVAAISGITGSLYQQFAITIAVSVVFSALNSLTLSPALSSILLKEPKPAKGIVGKFFRGFNKGFNKANEKYTSFSHVVARKATRGVIFIVIFLFLAGVLGKFIPGGFIPEEDMGYFFINAQLPEAASLQRTDLVARKIEKILSSHEEVEFSTSIPGYSMLTGGFSTNSVFIFVSCKEWGERGKEGEVHMLIRKLNREFSAAIQEAPSFAFGPPAIPGLGNGSGFSIMIQDKGSNSTPQYLAQQTQKFIQSVRQRPEISSVFTTYQASTPQRYLDVDREKAMKMGLNLNDVYNTISAFLGGTYVNDFNRFGRVYKSYLQAEPEYRLTEDDMDLFFIKNNEGKMIPLSSIATVENISGPEFTFRFNMYRAAEVTGGPAPGYSSAQALTALEEVAEEVLPDDIGYAWNAMSYQEKAAAGTAGVIFVFSLVFVFLILAAQYESWSLPFAILLGTPFAIFGAFLGIWIARFSSDLYVLNIFAQVSLILLLALAAKNAILIVEYAKDKFEEGLSLMEAAIQGAKLRLRPILMTSFAFILGVVPLITASGAGSQARNVMGVAVFAGMLIATMLGIFMYPMLFVLIGKLGKYEKKRDLKKAQQTVVQNNE
ncbi:MAG TPA: multidrug efflux RND transporter permease subunit [Bacteroidales bacterium]|nr:multidrug efflux RND transporter permease subunit [Bacteroidales bacterium]HRZ20264.1 multidrug efflux RND transporter permease subunit [Bacteroidales bacterium]